MGGKAFVVLAGLALLGAAQAPEQIPALARGLVFDGLPPDRLQGNNRTRIRFFDTLDVEEACGVPSPDKTFLGCVRGPVHKPIIYMPNPCRRSGEYARVLCHELGHVNGWTKYHEY